MKRRDLIRKLEEAGFVFLRNGAKHQIYKRGKVQETVSYEREIPEGTARAILKRNGIKYK